MVMIKQSMILQILFANPISVQDHLGLMLLLQEDSPVADTSRDDMTLDDSNDNINHEKINLK